MIVLVRKQYYLTFSYKFVQFHSRKYIHIPRHMYVFLEFTQILIQKCEWPVVVRGEETSLHNKTKDDINLTKTKT